MIAPPRSETILHGAYRQFTDRRRNPSTAERSRTSRQSVFGRLAGYEDVNDADRLCRDPDSGSELAIRFPGRRHRLRAF
jgi:hypothetical protein